MKLGTHSAVHAEWDGDHEGAKNQTVNRLAPTLVNT